MSLEKTNSITLLEAARTIQKYEDGGLKERIAQIERVFCASNKTSCVNKLNQLLIDHTILESALAFKRVAGQVHVIIHSVAILLCLPNILSESEVVESLSLGAGSTGKNFDLETSERVAEFKFISWKGGSEAVRQNSLFKDFFLLAEYPTRKTKYLYVIGKEYPLRFLNGNRAIDSVLSRNVKLRHQFNEKYGTKYKVVSEYYREHQDKVIIEDISAKLPSLTKDYIDAEENESSD